MKGFLALITVFIVLLSVNSFAVAPYTLTGFEATNEELDPGTGATDTTISVECYDRDGARVLNQTVDLSFYERSGAELMPPTTLVCSGSADFGPITNSGLYYTVAELPAGSQCAKTGGCKQKAWFSITKPFVQMKVPDNNAFLAIAIAFGVLFIASKK